MPKIEVGEFFKPYNFALGFQFENPKYTALHFKFWAKVEFERFCPYWGSFDIILDTFASFHEMSWWLVFLHFGPK
jgi:hypothetical protein